MELIKCFELDFGDTNLISKNKKDILDWIEVDLDNLQNPVIDEQESQESQDLQYIISIKLMTQQELDALPEWS